MQYNKGKITTVELLTTGSSLQQLKLRFFDREVLIKSDSGDFINCFARMYRRFNAQPSCNQNTPLLPPFARERGSVIDYPPLIPPFARGDTGGCKKLSETCLHETRPRESGDGEKKFLQDNTTIDGQMMMTHAPVEFILLTNPDNSWGKPVLILDREVIPLNDTGLLDGYAYENILISIITRIRSHFLIHAGVVSYAGAGIILAADAMHGKTTLVLELIRRGFRFLSDEFAALGRNDRFVYPFPRSLRVRRGTLELAGFPSEAAGAPLWLGKLILDIEEIQPNCLGKVSSINHIIILKDPAEGEEDTGVNSRKELSIYVDRLDDTFLATVSQIEGVTDVQTGNSSIYPMLKLHAIRTTPVLTQIEALCRDHRILVLDIIKGTKRRPAFQAPARLKEIPKSQAVMELLSRFQAGYRSELLKDEFGGSSTRLFMELSSAIAHANCYQLSVGPLQEMADLVCGLAGA
ncbi:MAG: hypothetical protein E3K36_09370 [Candidatus Brocadia sp.]|nr:hypothetical protein [Candidatus Brocadia sp.]